MLPDYAPGDPILRLNHRKYDVVIGRLRAKQLCFKIEIGTMDAPNIIYQRVSAGVRSLSERIGLHLPPALGAINSFHRTPWILLTPGNEPRNGGSMRHYKHSVGSELAAWWSFTNVRKNGTRSWTPPPGPDNTSADFNIFIGAYFTLFRPMELLTL